MSNDTFGVGDDDRLISAYLLVRFHQSHGSSSSGARIKYKLYSLYGWGAPGALTLVTGIVQGVMSHDEHNQLVPHFSNPYCWFRGEPSQSCMAQRLA